MTCKSNVYTPKLPHSYTAFNFKEKFRIIMYKYGNLAYLYIIMYYLT